MEQQQTSGPKLFFEAGDRDDARLAAAACDRAVAVLGERWGLSVPPDCFVYVVADGRSFVTDSAPPLWQALLTVTRPLWSRSLARTWRFSGGLSQRYGDRWVVGVKPVRLLRTQDQGMQHKLFLDSDDPERRLAHVVCHELTHAAGARLRLPDWLDEGLAMVAVEHCAGAPTVRSQTVSLLARPTRRQERKHPVDAALRQFARDYWAVRYLDEARPGLLRETFAQAQPGHIDAALAQACDVDVQALRGHLEQGARERYG